MLEDFSERCTKQFCAELLTQTTTKVALLVRLFIGTSTVY